MSRRRKQRQNRAASKSGDKAPRKGAAKTYSGGLGTWALRGAGICAVLLLVGLVGGYFWVQSYLRSESFRRDLAGQVGAAIQGTASLEPLDWQGTVVSTSEVTLSSSGLGDWSAGETTAVFDLGGIWRKTWLIESLTVDHAEVHYPAQKATAIEASPSSGEPPKSAPSRSSSGGFLPNRSEVSQLTIQSFDGSLQTGGGAYRWQDVTVESAPRGQTIDLTLRGGELQTPSEALGELRLREATVRKNGSDIFLTKSEWRLLDRGTLEVRGSRLKGRTLLEGELRDLELASLLTPYWQQRVSGEVASELEYLDPSDGSPRVTAVTSIGNGSISSLPILNRLASYSANPRLQRLSLEECRGEIIWQEGRWQLQNLVLEDVGTLRIEGDLQLHQGQLAGDLRVGVPPGLLAKIPGAEEKVFFPGDRGLLWAPVQISGTLSEPKEDLSARMIRAAQERMFELVPETGLWALRYGADTLDSGTQALLGREGIVLENSTRIATEAVEQGARVVEDGVQTGFGILNGILGGSRQPEREEEAEEENR